MFHNNDHQPSAISTDQFGPVPSRLPLTMDSTSDKMQYKNRPNDGREFVCGWGAASINIISTFPINKLIFRQQVSGINALTALQQLQLEGLGLLYRGVLPPLVQKTTSLAIMFGMYDQFGRMLDRSCSVLSSRARKGMAAVLAGCVEATLTPFERIQTLLQDRGYHQHYRNMAHAFHDIGWKYGIREYFRGLTPILIRNGPSNAVFFLFRGEVKQRLPTPRTSMADVAENFFCGGILGATISTFFFPVNVVKTHMQRHVGGKFESFSAAWSAVYHERNRSMAAMFRGVHVNCIRSLLSWGIINASYELLKKLLYSNSLGE
jgi:hypothetical protein